MLTFIDSNNNNEVVKWTEQVQRKAFYIHGTTSDPERWDNWKEAVEVLNKIALPDVNAVDTAFDWSKEATQFNSLKERWSVSDRLVQYVKANALEKGFTEIALIGHSHGGNVAIMAADKLAKESGISTIYIITVGTPVFNKKTFSTSSSIEGLKQAAETKVTYKDNGMSAPYRRTSTIYTYSYFNPENPVNWGNEHKIKHLSIYNDYDRVDGLAQAFDPFIENSRMTSNTNTFEYNRLINKPVKSNITVNEINRAKYCRYCLCRIAVLVRLHQIISRVETPFEETLSQTPVNKNQDNTRVVKNIREIKILGYRKISQLPAFKTVSLNAFLSGSLPPIDNHIMKSMTLEQMRFLFANEMQFIIFSNKFAEESKQQLQQEWPYFKKGDSIETLDLRSPNSRLIGDEIERLTKEITRVRDINIRTNKDKLQNSHWALWLIYNTLSPARDIFRYVTEGVDNHGFDINSPELIQQEIDKGNIKPFPRVSKTDTRS